MTRRLHIDIETYSPVDLSKCGVHLYAAHPEFEILMLAFRSYENDVLVKKGILDLANDYTIVLPIYIAEALFDCDVEKHAHNAPFEIACLNAFYGIELDVTQWHCTMVKAATHGLPLGLDRISEELNLGDSAKDKAGKELIKLFSVPLKPTAKNCYITRATAQTHPEEWQKFMDYCEQDVAAEAAVYEKLSKYKVPEFEHTLWVLDQKINNRGVLLDRDFINATIAVNGEIMIGLTEELAKVTGLQNSKSPKQFGEWLSARTGLDVDGMTKDAVKEYTASVGASDPIAATALDIYPKVKRTSIAKYSAMLNCVGGDGLARGLFQFAGAGRTGRWAGRRVQPQNMPKTHLNNIEDVRTIVKHRDTGSLTFLFEDVTSVLSQLIRTAIIADAGKKLVVCDFSAIEARVVAWLAKCQWRLEVFATHGKIYEASASAMFKVPLSAVTKDSDYRARAKVAELALGYQGSRGALIAMGAEDMGMSEQDMDETVRIWREANPEIVSMWNVINNLSIQALKNPRVRFKYLDILTFTANSEFLKITLPSGRGIYYYRAQLTENRFGREGIKYRGQVHESGLWGWVETYGGKLTENISQALARDLMADALVRMDAEGIDLLLHVHDEGGAQADADKAAETLETMRRIMSHTPSWAKGLPLAAEGFISDFYKKD